jgi:predicted AAA+ superfamily ATPase
MAFDDDDDDDDNDNNNNNNNNTVKIANIRMKATMIFLEVQCARQMEVSLKRDS